MEPDLDTQTNADWATNLEGRKPSRSGLGKPVLPDVDISGKEHLRAGDNQVGSHGSASISTPAGQVGSACEALSAKDGVEAGSSPVLLGTSVLKGPRAGQLLYLPSPPPEKRRPGRPRKDRSLEPSPSERKKRAWKVVDDRPEASPEPMVEHQPETSPDYQPEPAREFQAEAKIEFQAEAALQNSSETPPEAAPRETPLPKIVMTRPYGFIADNGLQYHWFQGETIDDPRVIALLLGRGCADYTMVDRD